jgi:hypothetical protein
VNPFQWVLAISLEIDFKAGLAITDRGRNFAI